MATFMYIEEPTGGGLDTPSGLLFYIDPSDSNSYSGSGQTLAALDSDGSAITAYDMWLGADDSSSTDDPTFSTNKFTFDGGDYFNFKTLPDFFKNLHAQDGSNWWFAIAFKTATADATWSIAGQNGGQAGGGLGIYHSGAGDGRLTLLTNNAADTTTRSAILGSEGRFSNTTEHLLIITADVSETTSNVKSKVDSAAIATNDLTFQNEGETSNLGFYLCGLAAGFHFTSGMEFYGAAWGNEFASDADIADIKTWMEDITGKTF